MDLELCLSIDERSSYSGFVCLHSLFSRLPGEKRPGILLCHPAKLPSPAEEWCGRLERAGITVQIRSLPLDVSVFRHCKSIYDSHAAYFRLVAPEYSVAKRLVYTDTDVLFFTEIERFFQEDLGGAVIGMRSGPRVGEREELEKKLLLKHGKNADDPYFGSGLAVIDTALYRKQRIAEKCLEIIEADSASLKHSDQSVWNAAVPHISDIGTSYIQTAPPGGNKRLRDGHGIIHFVGSPKPWDLFADFFHPHAQLWFSAARASGVKLPKARRYLDPHAWARARRVSRQYSVWKHPRGKTD